jgi:hypothetical protein
LGDSGGVFISYRRGGSDLRKSAQENDVTCEFVPDMP